jgi:ribosomal protein S18 acetylase RimI-like enzyme
MASQPEPMHPPPPPSGPTRTPSPPESTGGRAAAVRRAEPADVPALTRMLVRAYMDDPIAVWICDSQGLRARTLAAMYSVRLHQLLSQRGVWTNPRHTSAAIWLPPDCVKPALRPSAALLRCLLDPRMLARAPLLALGLRSMDRVHPEGPPHWYLSLLGTDPEAQGNGLGSAVLEPVL